jgi:hypothetical protein
MVGVAVRVHSRTGAGLGICHVPLPIEFGDVLELGRGPILLLRVIELVETGPHSPLARAREGRAETGRRGGDVSRGARLVLLAGFIACVIIAAIAWAILAIEWWWLS